MKSRLCGPALFATSLPSITMCSLWMVGRYIHRVLLWLAARRGGMALISLWRWGRCMSLFFADGGCCEGVLPIWVGQFILHSDITLTEVKTAFWQGLFLLMAGVVGPPIYSIYLSIIQYITIHTGVKKMLVSIEFDLWTNKPIIYPVPAREPLVIQYI